jgi:hypothetical protein
MSRTFTDIEIENYQFLIDAHKEMIGGKKKVDKEYAVIKKNEQVIKETMGTLDKKNYPQKVKALKVLFSIQLKKKKKIYSNIKRVLKLKVVRVKAEAKMENQKNIVAEIKSRFASADKALIKYDNQLESMITDASALLPGKPKKYKNYAALESFQMGQLGEELKSAVSDADSDDALKLKRASERASTAIWAAQRVVKNTRKKHAQLNKQVQSSQKTYLKLQKAHQLAKQRVAEGAALVEVMVAAYTELQTDIFTVSDAIKPDVSKDNVMKLVPKITADIQAAVEAAGGFYGGSYDNYDGYDSDEDDEVFSGGATTSRLHKYGNTVEKLMKSFDKTVKKFETDTKTRNKTLIDNLGVFGDILNKLGSVNDLVRTYVDDAERLQGVAGIAAEKVNYALGEWRRTTEDGINKDRKKMDDDLAKDGPGKGGQESEAEGGYFSFW